MLPDYLPPTDFEVASVWKAEPFGDQGGGLMFMSDIVDGTFSFKVYMYQYIHDQNSVYRGMNLCTFSAETEYDGEKYHFSANQWPNGIVGVDSLSALDGDLSFSTETITLKYHDAKLYAFYTGTADFKFGELPLFEDEISLPFTNTPTPDEPECMIGPPLQSIRYDDGMPVWIINKYEWAELSATEYNDQPDKLYYYVWNFVTIYCLLRRKMERSRYMEL